MRSRCHESVEGSLDNGTRGPYDSTDRGNTRRGRRPSAQGLVSRDHESASRSRKKSVRSRRSANREALPCQLAQNVLHCYARFIQKVWVISVAPISPTESGQADNDGFARCLIPFVRRSQTLKRQQCCGNRAVFGFGHHAGSSAIEMIL
jgi:hypothetical protein